MTWEIYVFMVQQQAFQATWAAACEVEISTMIIPSDYEFLMGPISFDGPYCQKNIVFQVNPNMHKFETDQLIY